MRSPLYKPRIINALVLAFTLLLSGCTALRTAYSHGPTWVYWHFDGYADWRSEQAPDVRASIAQWFDWHRREQLPEMGRLLAQWRDAAHHDVQASTVCAWGRELQALAAPAFNQALPALVREVHRLSPAQVAHFERKFDKVNAQYAKTHLQPDPHARLDEQLKRTVSRAERLYKRLTPEQVAALRDALVASPTWAQRWLSERERRQREIVRVLRAAQTRQATPAHTEAALRGLFVSWQHPADPSARRAGEARMAFNCELAARLHNSTSPTQREAARATLASWYADVQALVAQSGD